MKSEKIYRYGYIPVFNIDNGEYFWKKLKVVSIWRKPSFDFLNKKGYDIIYILENCKRFSEYNLITEEKTLQMSPKKTHNMIMNNLMLGIGLTPRTIFSPINELKLRGRELEDLVRQSDETIKECIEKDYIIGEKI